MLRMDPHPRMRSDFELGPIPGSLPTLDGIII